MERAQASIELITILSVSLLVLGIIMTVSRNAFEDMQTSLDVQLTEKTLRTLSNDAVLAYNSGPGTIIKSSLHIPVSAIPEESYFEDGIINVRVEHKYGVRDIPQVFSVPVKWNVPIQPGDHEVYCVSHNGYVYITDNPSLLPSTWILYVNTAVGESKDTKISVKNPGYNVSVISARVDPTPQDFTVSLGWTSQSLRGNDEKPLTVTVSSDHPVDYEGYLRLTSDSGEYDKILLRIKVK